MDSDIFSGLAEYTIDSSSLMDIFGDTPWVSKKNNPGLWGKIVELVDRGIIISHAEVLLEIKKDGTKGEELYDWAHTHEHIFKPHDERGEGIIIRSMSKKYKAFVNDKIGSAHADPWLIAQAKHRGLKIISEETLSNSPKPENCKKIPNVCRDPLFDVECLNLWELTKERHWTFQ
jgi:hypothetical protein